MVGSEEKNTNQEYDMDRELSTLVENNIIPSKLAEKLSQKLRQKNVKLTKNQLYLLVNKINEIMTGYKKADIKNLDISKPSGDLNFDQNMQKLVESVDKLEQRLTNLEENSNFKKTNKSRFVKTDDIKINEEVKIPSYDINLDPLTEVPGDPESVVVLMKWLQYLIDKCGRENLSNILDYYVDIGWITEDAKISLIDYSHGITEENKKTDTTKNISDLPSKDHIQTLIFIQKLKGNDFDKHFIDRIDSELTRITKKLNNYNIK